MFPFLETIQLKNGAIQNLFFHQERIKKTLLAFYKKPSFAVINELENFSLSAPNKKIYKLRILYNDSEYSTEILEYSPQKHNTFYTIEKPDFLYSYKYSQRQFFTLLKEKHPHKEIIFTQKNRITDTTYSNLIFKNKDKWFTPKTYLLNGTKRQQLLSKGLIFEAEISTQNLTNYSSFKLINAMLDFETSTEYEIGLIEN